MTTEVTRPFRGVSAEERRRQRHTALIEAGLTVIAAVGIAGATIEAISAEAGLSKRYFYEHFRSRDQLVAALSQDLIERILSGSVEAVRSTGDLDERLRNASSWVVTFLTGDPRRARLFVELIGNAQGHADVERAEHALAELLVDELAAGTGIPDAQRDRQYVVTVVLVTGTVQAVADWLDGTSRLSRDDLVDTIANLSTR